MLWLSNMAFFSSRRDQSWSCRTASSRAVLSHPHLWAGFGASPAPHQGSSSEAIRCPAGRKGNCFSSRNKTHQQTNKQANKHNQTKPSQFSSLFQGKGRERIGKEGTQRQALMLDCKKSFGWSLPLLTHQYNTHGCKNLAFVNSGVNEMSVFFME